jgi:hypothetical protein
VAESRFDRVRVGGRSEEGMLPEGDILADHNQIGRKESAHHRGSRAYSAQLGVRIATDRRAVSGKEGARPKPGPEGSHDPAPCQTVRETGSHGAFEPAQTGDKGCQNKKCETNLSRKNSRLIRDLRSGAEQFSEEPRESHFRRELERRGFSRCGGIAKWIWSRRRGERSFWSRLTRMRCFYALKGSGQARQSAVTGYFRIDMESCISQVARIKASTNKLKHVPHAGVLSHTGSGGWKTGMR